MPFKTSSTWSAPAPPLLRRLDQGVCKALDPPSLSLPLASCCRDALSAHADVRLSWPLVPRPAPASDPPALLPVVPAWLPVAWRRSMPVSCCSSRTRLDRLNPSLRTATRHACLSWRVQPRRLPRSAPCLRPGPLLLCGPMPGLLQRHGHHRPAHGHKVARCALIEAAPLPPPQHAETAPAATV